MGKRGRRKTRTPRTRAERTTPVTAHFVDVDDTRTYLVFGAFTESMIGLTAGEAPAALVRADLTGKWNHGAEDKPVLMLAPELAREWGQTLIEAADGAESDLRAYLAGYQPHDHEQRR